MGKDFVDRLAEESVKAKELIGDLHTWHKTIRDDIREARDTAATVASTAVDAALEEAVRPLLDTALADLTAKLDKLTTDIEAGLTARFEKLTNLMVHGNEQGRGDSIVDDAIKRWLHSLVTRELPRALEAVVMPTAEKITRHCMQEARAYLEALDSTGDTPVRIDITIPPAVVRMVPVVEPAVGSPDLGLAR